MNEAARLGLTYWLIPDRPHSLAMFGAFAGALAFANDSKDPNDWTKLHLTMGVVRVLDLCRHSELLTDDRIGKLINGYLQDKDLVKGAYTYLEDAPVGK